MVELNGVREAALLTEASLTAERDTFREMVQEFIRQVDVDDSVRPGHELRRLAKNYRKSVGMKG